MKMLIISVKCFKIQFKTNSNDQIWNITGGVDKRVFQLTG